MCRVSRNKVQTTLFSPKVFQVSVGRNSSVGGLGHTGEVTEENAVGKTKSEWDVVKFRIQFGC